MQINCEKKRIPEKSDRKRAVISSRSAKRGAPKNFKIALKDSRNRLSSFACRLRCIEAELSRKSSIRREAILVEKVSE